MDEPEHDCRLCAGHTALSVAALRVAEGLCIANASGTAFNVGALANTTSRPLSDACMMHLAFGLDVLWCDAPPHTLLLREHARQHTISTVQVPVRLSDQEAMLCYAV